MSIYLSEEEKYGNQAVYIATTASLSMYKIQGRKEKFHSEKNSAGLFINPSIPLVDSDT